MRGLTGGIKLCPRRSPSKKIVFSGAFISVIYGIKFPDCSFRSPLAGWVKKVILLEWSVEVAPGSLYRSSDSLSGCKKVTAVTHFFKPSLLFFYFKGAGQTFRKLNLFSSPFSICRSNWFCFQILFSQGPWWTYNVPLKTSKATLMHIQYTAIVHLEVHLYRINILKILLFPFVWDGYIADKLNQETTKKASTTTPLMKHI